MYKKLCYTWCAAEVTNWLDYVPQRRCLFGGDVRRHGGLLGQRSLVLACIELRAWGHAENDLIMVVARGCRRHAALDIQRR
jgi:hypothetical protein